MDPAQPHLTHILFFTLSFSQASALSSVLLARGSSSSALQHLLVAEGRLVIAGAVHSHDWGHASAQTHGNDSSADIGESSSTNSNSPLSSESPVAVLLVSPTDFCHPSTSDQEHADAASSKRSRKQQQHTSAPAMGDLLLQRMLLRQAGVRVVEISLEEWEGVKQHGAAADLLVSTAVEQQL